MMFKLSLSSIGRFFEIINSKMPLFLPVGDSPDSTAFKRWTSGSRVNLDSLSTSMSPKDFFFRSSEDIASFKISRKEIEISESRVENEPFVLFGVRACDASGIELLDRVFLAEPVDSYYQMRRQNGIIITLGCSRPEESCFCGALDVDATNPGGDIATWSVGDFLYLDVLTEKGQDFADWCFDALDGLFTHALDVDDKVIEEHRADVKKILARLPFADLSFEKFTKERLLTLFESSKWASLSQACLGCSLCTFVCPTCHCYDISDFDSGDEAVRSRCWDSCMNYDFTLMAHGNPREGLTERFRQRYMHKLVYFPENNDGRFGCVGCGRCVRKCPVFVNIVKVVKEYVL